MGGACRDRSQLAPHRPATCSRLSVAAGRKHRLAMRQSCCVLAISVNAAAFQLQYFEPEKAADRRSLAECPANKVSTTTASCDDWCNSSCDDNKIDDQSCDSSCDGACDASECVDFSPPSPPSRPPLRPPSSPAVCVCWVNDRCVMSDDKRWRTRCRTSRESRYYLFALFALFCLLPVLYRKVCRKKSSQVLGRDDYDASMSTLPAAQPQAAIGMANVPVPVAVAVPMPVPTAMATPMSTQGS